MRSWLLRTVLLTLLVATAIAGANAAVDLFGIFRNPQHRALPVYGEERIAKYLLSHRYVPANFDGLLIGSSVTANWNVGGMRSARLYNESLTGGNAVEIKPIVDVALANWTPAVAVMLVHPYFTDSHEFNAVQPSEHEVFGALGSLNLLEAYKSLVRVRLGRAKLTFDALGTADFGDQTNKLNSVLEAMMRPRVDFTIDAVAREAYGAIVTTLRARKIPVLFVVPPIAENLLDGKREAFAKYVREMVSDVPAAELVDFTGEPFVDLRRNPDHFSDGVHLRPAGAAKVVAVLDARLAELRRTANGGRTPGIPSGE